MDKIIKDLNFAVGTQDDIEIEKYIIDEDIDINDYIPADKDDNFVEFDLLNVFTCYYKQLYQLKQEAYMFEGIDSEKKDSTNRCVELLYEEIYKFQISTNEDKDVLYSPDDESINYDNSIEIFVLYVSGEPIYATQFMLPLLRYVSELDWINLEWSIIKIKG